jgi:sugar phosphate isomerase/epimerase
MKASPYVLLLLLLLLPGFKAASQTISKLGMVARIDQDSLLYASGFSLMGESVGRMLSPSLTEAEFQANIKKMNNTKTKVYVCNVLFPATLKIAGPEVDEAQVLAFVDQVFYRAKRAGVPVIVLGSGGSRRLPEGYDNQTAKTAFTGLCRKMAKVAKKHGITIAIESLNSGETNFLNTLQETAEVVKQVDHPNFRLNADIYHMMKENESPQQIIDAGKIIVYVEIAEKEGRTMPGVKGDDFRPYFRALKSIGYKGPVVIEGKVNNPAKEIPFAAEYLTKQLREVYLDSSN